jgi:glutathione S-transferase
VAKSVEDPLLDLQHWPGMSSTFVLWASELSPFALKLRALCDFAGIRYDWLPNDGTRLRNWRIALAIERGKRRRTIVRYPAMDPLDEVPLVPFLIEPGGRIQFDSSAIARWIDAERPAPGGALFPEDAALQFAAGLLDEAFDEVGLYLVHHNRWVLSAATNDAGARLAREQRHVLLPGMGRRFARWFAERQVRRLPYLFSVAPEGFTIDGVPPRLTPPALVGFPPTHALLDSIWHDVLEILEDLLAHRPFVLGERFTIADASIYGQLAMNLKDPTANGVLRERAPRTHAWLGAIRAAEHGRSRGDAILDSAIEPLFRLIGETFVPLMRQNESAWTAARASGQTCFNEAAFERGVALYDGTLRGQPFRSVAKAFQVRVWQDLCRSWHTLPAADRDRLSRHGMNAAWFAATGDAG